MRARLGLDGPGARRELGQAADAARDVLDLPGRDRFGDQLGVTFRSRGALSRATRTRAIMLASLRARRALPRLPTRLSVGWVMRCASSVTEPGVRSTCRTSDGHIH